LYFARMKRDNRIGPRVIGTVPTLPRLSPRDLGALAGRTDVVVVDTRPRAEFLAAHLPKSLLAELDFQFANITGSYIEEETPIYLVIDESRVGEAVRILLRIGLDHLRGYVTPGDLAAYQAEGGAMASIEAIGIDEMEQRRVAGGVHILDVRGRTDFDTAHVPGAYNIAHTRLLARLSELPNDAPVLVHCASGARSAHAVALLERHGYRPVTVADHFVKWQPAVATSA
jgi:hydroxyacylglutathione hydrolase